MQLSRKSTQASQPLVLWKVEKNVEKTIAEYTNRLSVKSRNKGDDNLICSYTFKLSNVTFKDEGEYQLKVEFAHEKRPLKSEVSLDVYGISQKLFLCCLSFQISRVLARGFITSTFNYRSCIFPLNLRVPGVRTKHANDTSVSFFFCATETKSRIFRKSGSSLLK